MSEQGDISSTSHHRTHIMGGNEDEGDRLFSVVPTVRAKGNGHKLNHMKFHLSTGKIFCNVRIIKRWKKVPREIEGSPFMAIQHSTGHGPWQSSLGDSTEPGIGLDSLQRCIPSSLLCDAVWSYHAAERDGQKNASSQVVCNPRQCAIPGSVQSFAHSNYYNFCRGKYVQTLSVQFLI